MKLSYTALKTFQQCHFCYHLRYDRGLASRPRPAAQSSRALHGALHLFHQGLKSQQAAKDALFPPAVVPFKVFAELRVLEVFPQVLLQRPHLGFSHGSSSRMARNPVSHSSLGEGNVIFAELPSFLGEGMNQDDLVSCVEEVEDPILG